MEHAAANGAALTIAFATAAGIISQSIARSFHIPGIVILLLVGVLLGPELGGVIQPSSLGEALPQLVSFAVALILFEGGMHLKHQQFRRRSKSIRRLVTWGALITMVGGTLAARFIMHWPWRTSALFGALVIVTGPTVVTPLLKRFRLIQSVRTVLEAEGVLIDAVGAVIAVVALEIALEPSGISLARGLVDIGARLGFGVLLGVAGGGLLWVLLRYRGLVAEGLENVFTLALVWALFHSAEAVISESGIAAVTAAGVVVGNFKTARHRDLLEFNDQLTVMLIGMLFVLLAADVSLTEVRALGVRGLITVAVLVIVVRPANVYLCLLGTSLRLPARTFIAWIGPRGIIAAAVASLFASTLENAGIEGGSQLKALVFLVIAVTVTLAGLSGGFAASALGVRAKKKGWLLLGAGEVSCILARDLRESGVEVTCIDTSTEACTFAREHGIDVFEGNGLETEVLDQVHLNLREGVAALTPNDEINLLFIRKARREGGVRRLLAAIRTAKQGSTDEMIHHEGGQVLFGAAHDIAFWSGRLRASEATVQRFRAEEKPRMDSSDAFKEHFIPITHHRGNTAQPVAEDLKLRKGDELTALVATEHRSEALSELSNLGWAAIENVPGDLG